MAHISFWFMQMLMLGGGVHTIKKNAESSVAANKETGLEVNADKTKYMVMSRDQKAGRSYCKRLIIVPLKGWTILTNQNSIQEEIKSILKSGNACYHSVQNFCLPVAYPKILRLKYTEL
jgi:hypothetical protein